jgi:ubiquinone/menaquinone biosynthesis C-methylase UbiE
MAANVAQEKGYKGIAMEGFVARRYAKLRSTESQAAVRRQQAAELTADLPDGAELLEVAPGPGFFAIELARLGRFHVTGLDISRTFVEIAGENARTENVNASFRLGDASRMPFPDGSFDFIVCQAAFKNFARPGAAIDEMYRVLREGGCALIEDMNGNASDAGIREEVDAMRLGRMAALMTRRILRGLRRRAYTPGEFAHLAEESRFGGATISQAGIGVYVRLAKPGAKHGPAGSESKG